jgi:hypothetical protein
MAITQEVILKVGTNEAVASIKDIRNNIKAYKNDLVSLDEGSKAYNETLKKIAENQDVLDDINDDVRASTMKLTDYVGLAGKTANMAVAGFTVFKGTLALLGKENETLEKTFVKLQAAMALMQSVNALSSGFKALWVTIPQLRAAMAALNVTMKANPIGAVVTAVAALVAGITLLIGWIRKNNSDQKALNDENERAKRLAEDRKIQYEREIELLKAKGESEENLLKIEKDRLDKELAYFNTEVARITKRINLGQKVTEEQQKQYDEQDKIRGEYNHKIDVADAKLQRILTDRQKKEAEERAKAAKKAAEEYTEAMDAIDAARRPEYVENTPDVDMPKDVDIDTSKSDREIENLQTINDLMNERVRIAEELRLAQLPFDEQETYWQAEIDRNMALLESDLMTSDERIKALERLNNAEEKHKTASISRENQITDNKRKTADAAVSILNSSAKLAGESTEAGKALAVAATTISTWQSAQLAYQSAFLPVPTVASPALGALYAAAAVASGLANVKQILSTDTGSGSGSSSSAAPSMPTMPSMPELRQPIQETRSYIQGADEDYINRTQPVLVVEDLNQVQNRVKVAESDSKF